MILYKNVYRKKSFYGRKFMGTKQVYINGKKGLDVKNNPVSEDIGLLVFIFFRYFYSEL